MSETETKEAKVFIATFGCQMNEYDSDRAVRLLAGHGYSQTGDPAEADLIFLNTCSIREKAEQKVYSMLGRLRPLKVANPDLIIAVGGCVAQQVGDAFLSRAPYLDLVVGTHGIHKLPELLENVRRSRRSVCHTDFDYLMDIPPVLDGGTRRLKAFLTIMQGCDNFCAYCVVPYVRGREISRKPEDILTEARDLIDHGVKEITLLGQNVNSYGRGLETEIDFPGLIEKMAALPGLLRLRFTTSHPKDLSPRLVQALAEIPIMARHVHLPVQSGSNTILKAMGRGYTRENYLERVAALRLACPDIALTTDIIVGFPGESEADFQETMNLVNEVQYDNMFSFKYSDRPGTRASQMDNAIDEETKKRRLAELQGTQREITARLSQLEVGRRPEVLVEGVGKRDPRQLTGRTPGNRVVNFQGSPDLIGRMVRPLIVQACPNSLTGRLDDEGRSDDKVMDSTIRG